MARASKGAILLCAVAAVLAASWFCNGCLESFVQPARGAAAAGETTHLGISGAAAAGVAAPLLLSQPAFAADSPPGWPFLLAFTTVISVIFIIPNIVFPGPKR
eukprot:TRINITY_DN44797_c0_g3_i1.p2 TRINITY_DN44797_c0_g3~~TRINITY_DN44797_c0_g3_i1.p2  ORF type:complete len:103 (+),score=29.99 TRINITY_DN44797_c0_g3_i1:87-395(+)